MSNVKKHIGLIRWALGVILAMDVGLVILNLRGPGSPQQLRAENNRFRAQLSLLEADVKRGKSIQRSEEHTSELQSLRHLVCRLLLEKKKIRISTNNP